VQGIPRGKCVESASPKRTAAQHGSSTKTASCTVPLPSGQPRSTGAARSRREDAGADYREGGGGFGRFSFIHRWGNGGCSTMLPRRGAHACCRSMGDSTARLSFGGRPCCMRAAARALWSCRSPGSGELGQSGGLKLASGTVGVLRPERRELGAKETAEARENSARR
jgi:hypothetical protein